MTLDASLVQRLYGEAEAASWELAPDTFRATLEASVAHALGAKSIDRRALEQYLSSLHLRDLALAAACAAAQDAAWNHFVTIYRPALYRAADAIDPTGGARDLADSLYGDLFGLREREGVRQSLFRYYHGRSSLATWLRAVLAQRHVDRVRAGRRLDPLPDDESTAAAHVNSGVPDPDRVPLEHAVRRALESAVRSLAPRDRLRLGCYYVQNMKLAAIGRMLGEHEATASRHLARTRAAIREAVERRLRDDHGMDDDVIAQCFRTAVEDPGTLNLASLVGAGPERKNDG
jgi:RNA polymerase sigma-70 factor (ECF subfamily)